MTPDDRIGYSADFPAADQVEAEEMIAAMIFDRPALEVSEHEAAELGRDILNAVLWRFRRDLFEYSPSARNARMKPQARQENPMPQQRDPDGVPPEPDDFEDGPDDEGGDEDFGDDDDFDDDDEVDEDDDLFDDEDE